VSTSGCIQPSPVVLLSATVCLTGAQIATAFSAPTTLVVAPPAGQALFLVELFSQFVVGVSGYRAFNSYGVYPGAWGATTQLGDLKVFDAFNNLPPFDQVNVLGGNPGITIATPAFESKALVAAAGFNNPTVCGPIVTSTLAAGGTGYVAGDTGTVDGANYGASAAYVVDTVDLVTGAVLTYHLTAVGTGYDITGNPHTTTDAGGQPGIGVGFTVNVTAVPPPDGQLCVTVIYQVLTLH
jgi:hypothetical protein